MLSNIKKLIDFVIEAHSCYSREPEQAVRRWDGKTPYYVHPIWCAMMILQEENLPEEIRVIGAEVLLLHDVREDTTKPLPDYSSEKVKALVDEMTFDSSDDEMIRVWERSDLAKLFKLYDKVSNLLDCGHMSAEKRRKYIVHALKLTDFIEARFGVLNITKMARAIAQ